MDRTCALLVAGQQDSGPHVKLLPCPAPMILIRLLWDAHLTSDGLRWGAMALCHIAWVLDFSHPFTLRLMHRHMSQESSTAPRVQAVLNFGGPVD